MTVFWESGEYLVRLQGYTRYYRPSIVAISVLIALAKKAQQL